MIVGSIKPVRSVVPFVLGILGWPYLLAALAGGAHLLAGNLRLLRRPTDRRLAMANFHSANLYLLLLFLGVVLDVVLRRWPGLR